MLSVRAQEAVSRSWAASGERKEGMRPASTVLGDVSTLSEPEGPVGVSGSYMLMLGLQESISVQGLPVHGYLLS